MKKYLLFRISSKGYPKIKVDTLSKLDCLSNLMSIFRGWEFICVADNCDESLLAHLKSQKFSMFIETNLGNPGSFWRLYEVALGLAKNEDIFYFVEDDYWHLPQAPTAIIEGLQYFDYVTSYDHPDKYRESNRVLNPYAKLNQFSESTQVVRGNAFLWRTSNSTTMTFGLLGKTLIADADIWSMTSYRKGDYDFEIFSTLTKQALLLRKRYLYLLSKMKFFFKPKRYLGVCVPGLSLHLEIAYLSRKDIERFQLPI